MTQLKTLFTFLPDSPSLYDEWEQLILQYGVTGRQAHDARLIAAMKVHGLSKILTFNGDDFKRFTNITVLSPEEVVKSLPPPAANNNTNPSDELN